MNSIWQLNWNTECMFFYDITVFSSNFCNFQELFPNFFNSDIFYKLELSTSDMLHNHFIIVNQEVGYKLWATKKKRQFFFQTITQ